ncbi:villin-1 [Oryza brachyantha]|uniref:Gelsolin-like domain-containing protein n=1 Tax=Oryza brachyantha TaxID=4533 RepID=J3M423_ORYBR|nr:villin-1 [Oryza brachyantha]
MKGVDDAFLGVGDKPGLDIWCIMGSNLVAIEKPMHGKFYTGNTYITLSTVELRSGVRQHNVHYWVGDEAKEEDYLMASDKAVELDAALGSNTVQYRETQGEESDKFLSYFKPCIIPIQGSLSSHMRISGDKSNQTTMFMCEGEHVARVTEVPFSRSSLDHKAVFIVDTQSKIFVFSGCNSSLQTRAKALDVVQYLKENRHCGRCEIATIEDGKLVGDSDAGDFWNLFGGYAPIPRDVEDTTMTELMTTSSKKLFWINKRNLVPVETHLLEREILNSDRNYILDCGTEVFLWMGMTTLVSERRTSATSLEDYMRCEGRQSNARSIILTEGHETVEFKMHFQHWPKNVVPKLYEAGREKVAAIFKHQGYDVTEIPEDKPRYIISCNGSLKVWLVDDGSVSLLCTEEQEQLYNGDCYIIQYSYVEDGKDYHLFFAWSGQNSVNEDRVAATSLISGMADSVKGHAVVAQVFQGREPEMFFLVFKSLIIFKGGRSMGHKNFVSQRSDINGSYQKQGVALFRVQGLKHDCIQAIQVDLDASSLNSSHCYILQAGDSFFTWLGGLSSPSDHNLLDRMMDKLCPLKQSMLVREGSEPGHFWEALGGRSEYSKEKHVKDWPADPRLYTCFFEQGLFKVKEVFSFSQDDLATEEILILDCVEEFYVWVGLHSGVLSKDQALDIGKMFLQAGIHQEGRRSIDTTMYIVMEGDEPKFFTSFFNWDYSKQAMLGNSFERKLAILKGVSQKLETPERSIRKSSSLLTRRAPPGTSSEPATPEQRAAARPFSSASTGRLARERSPAASTAASSPSPSLSSTPSPSPRSRSSASSSPSWNSTPTTVARRLFPPSSEAARHPVATGSPRRR